MGFRTTLLLCAACMLACDAFQLRAPLQRSVAPAFGPRPATVAMFGGSSSSKPKLGKPAVKKVVKKVVKPAPKKVVKKVVKKAAAKPAGGGLFGRKAPAWGRDAA